MPALSPVTVLGLGPMGQAMVRTLIAAGHPVTVWNRTRSRADDVVAAGAKLAATPSEAVAAGKLVILSLTDYQAMWDVLGDSTGSLAGRTLVNLSSDTPDKTREAASWAASHGASFVAGGVMVPEPMVGTDLSYVYYSGDAEAFGAHRTTLAHIGEPRFLGDDPGRAQLMYQANLDVFLTTLAGFMHATALVGSAGITAEVFLPEVMQLFKAIPVMMDADGVEKLGARIDAGEHPGEAANAIMMGATADHIYATAKSSGVDTSLPGAVQEYYRRAIDDGHGTDSWTRIIDGMRGPRSR
ncbi:NAD(P)-dependent oxidoreductase [Streptomyces botrytidirepellens]|uniref:NAD(P)-dependent oxidoreductase n=1 Tax=Streptomyces botrytidirepellens TaxID=2486417 RepID=A0A3M8VYK4_9ACTN|nr:NAD(P)-binding domain-containing protein [Streptomyces botrytidirepellens]RNG20733.1 NAD(P)-dependent oxidoreductase [Streptomyces botrytidirepellens]